MRKPCRNQIKKVKVANFRDPCGPSHPFIFKLSRVSPVTVDFYRGPLTFQWGQNQNSIGHTFTVDPRKNRKSGLDETIGERGRWKIDSH